MLGGRYDFACSIWFSDPGYRLCDDDRCRENDNLYILVLQCVNDDVEKKAILRLSESVIKYKVKSKTVNDGGVEMTIEVRINESATNLVNELRSLDGVRNATLVSYNGEYMS